MKWLAIAIATLVAVVIVTGGLVTLAHRSDEEGPRDSGLGTRASQILQQTPVLKRLTHSRCSDEETNDADGDREAAGETEAGERNDSCDSEKSEENDDQAGDAERDEGGEDAGGDP